MFHVKPVAGRRTGRRLHDVVSRETRGSGGAVGVARRAGPPSDGPDSRLRCDHRGRGSAFRARAARRGGTPRIGLGSGPHVDRRAHSRARRRPTAPPRPFQGHPAASRPLGSHLPRSTPIVDRRAVQGALRSPLSQFRAISTRHGGGSSVAQRASESHGHIGDHSGTPSHAPVDDPEHRNLPGARPLPQRRALPRPSRSDGR